MTEGLSTIIWYSLIVSGAHSSRIRYSSFEMVFFWICLGTTWWAAVLMLAVCEAADWRRGEVRIILMVRGSLMIDSKEALETILKV
jgi:hypothetical protein